MLLIIILQVISGVVSQSNCSSTAADVGDISDNASKDEVAKYVYSYLISKGMDSVHAAAIVGYVDAEGGLSASTVQQGESAENTGWGLFQVTPVTRLKAFAEKQGLAWSSAAVQVDYAWTELHTSVQDDGSTSGSPDWYDIYNHGVSLSEWWNLTDVSEIAGIYTDCFGRGATSHYAYNDSHEVQARYWYGKLAGNTDTGTSGTITTDDTSATDTGGSCGSGSDSDSGGASAIGEKLSYYDDLEPYLEKWIGKSPYNYGGDPSNLNSEAGAAIGTDCSGFVGWAFSKIGIDFSGRPSTGTMYPANTYEIDESDAKAGDLIFFNGGGSVHHVGVYIGGGYMIDDENSGIKKSKIWSESHFFARVKSSIIPSQYQ